MYRLFVLFAVASMLAACAANVTEPALHARSDSAATPGASAARAAAAPPADAAVPVVEIEDFDDRLVCKDVTKPGTRIVIGQSCYSFGDAQLARERASAQHQVEAVLREQAELAQAARERDLAPQQPVLTIPRR